MLVICPSCKKRYKLDEKKLNPKPKIKLRCPNCGHIFEVNNPLYNEKINEDDTTQIKKDKNAEEGLTLPEDKIIYLYVIKGPRSGYKYKVTKPRVIVGRGSQADLIIPDLEVSRQHFSLEISENKTILRDLNSTNGTYIDGERVSSVKIEDRTEIQIGQSAILYMESTGRDF